MFDATSARIVLRNVYAELETLSQNAFNEQAYLSVVQSLHAFQTDLDIDLNFDLEDTLLQSGYESVAEAVEDAAITGQVGGLDTEVTYELTLQKVRELQEHLDETDPMAEEVDEDLLESYYELLQMVGVLADRDAVDVWSAFEVL